MHTRTIEEDFTFQVKKIVKQMRNQHEELRDLDSEELQDKLWDEYSREFAHAVMEVCEEFSDDETNLFE